MQRTPPRHLAPPQRTRSRARDHLLVESILALVAIGLTTAILIGSLVERPESSAARLPNLLPPAPTTTRAAATTPSPSSTRPAPGQNGNLLADPGFETGLDGWSAVGKAGLEQVEEGRSGDWGLRVTRGSSRWPGALHDEVASLKADRRYESSVWVKASKPGIEVQVNLFELRGGKRFAVDTVGAVVQSGEWRRLDVSHDTHRPGTTLALEVLAPNLASGTNLLVDDLAVRAASSSMSIH